MNFSNRSLAGSSPTQLFDPILYVGIQEKYSLVRGKLMRHHSRLRCWSTVFISADCREQSIPWLTLRVCSCRIRHLVPESIDQKAGSCHFFLVHPAPERAGGHMGNGGRRIGMLFSRESSPL